MDRKIYAKNLEYLAAAFPASKIDIENVKAAWWSDFENVQLEDFAEAVKRIRKSGERFFPSLGIMTAAVELVAEERAAREYAARIAEHQRIKSERMGPYASADISDSRGKQMAADTFKAIQIGLSLGAAGLAEEMEKLSGKYPEKRDWYSETADLVGLDYVVHIGNEAATKSNGKA